MKYGVYGIVVESDEPLAELEPVTDDDEDVHVDISIGRVSQPPPAMPGALLLPFPSNSQAPTWPAISRGDEGYCLNFDDQATFWVDASGRSIRCFHSLAPRETQVHLLLDHVVPRALYQLGLDPIHATAIAAPGGAVAFLGSSGAGKSTMAAALGATGCKLMTDDCLVLQPRDHSIDVAPGYAGLRLYSDAHSAVCPDAAISRVAHYTQKKRISRFVDLAKGSVPVRAIYVLSRIDGGQPLSFERLGLGEAVMALTANAFRMDLQQREPLKRQLRSFSRVAATVPIKRCHVPSDLATLREVGDRILEDAFARAE